MFQHVVLRPGSPALRWIGIRLSLLGILGLSVASAADKGPDFTTEVRPILANFCYKCHGPDDKGRKSGLRLDLAEAVGKPAKSGEIAIVPGHPEQSELIKRIFTADEDDVMPPPAAKQTLTAAQKDVLKRWVANGAEYRPHWAFVAPRKADLPVVRDTAWPQGAIDRFVLARIEAAGLKPAPPADRYSLIRRVYLDLIGVPPTPAEADAFVADTRPDAYARVVDQLLARPQYGERWARKWLDLARYADTNGYEKDRPRSMWPYRDWVINALNADMPFDQFTIRQVAGDLLPDATQQDRIATGFHRNTMINEEGGIDPLEYRFYALTDRVATTGKTWLGLTTGCAQCHTHKFDPITHREYYQLMAFMDNTDEPPSTLLKPDDFAQRAAAVEKKIADIIAAMPSRYPLPSEQVWKDLRAAQVATASGEKAVLQDDGSWLLSGPGSERDTYTVSVPSAEAGAESILLEVLPGGPKPSDGAGRAANGNFVLTEFTVEIPPAETDSKPDRVGIAKATSSFSQPKWDIAGAIDGKDQTGWAVDGRPHPEAPVRAEFTLAQALPAAAQHGLTITLAQTFGGHHTMRRFRLSLGRRVVSGASVEHRQAALAHDFARWLADERTKAASWQILRPTRAVTGVPVLNVQDDGSVLASGDQTKSDTYDLTFTAPAAPITALRLEVIPDERLPGGGPGRVYYEGSPGDFALNELTVAVDGAPVKLARGLHSFAKGGDDAAKAIDGRTDTNWSIRGGEGRYHTVVFVLEKPIAATTALTIRMLSERYYASDIGRFRWSVTSDPAPTGASALDPEAVAILVRSQDSWSQADLERLRREFLLVTPGLQAEQRKIRDLRASLRNFPTTLTMVERDAAHRRTTRIHHRGEYLQPTEEVTPDVLSVLNALPADAPRNRLGFARWLVSRDHPLTARVTVNRHWAAFFGRGFVRTVDDFGYQGESPSNQPLLDYLAVDFMDQGWSLKKLHRQIVLSATYQQASATTPALLERDQANLLLARGPRGRLDAEQIRDRLLAAAGLLSTKLGGPSVFPPQPESVTTEGAYGAFAWKTSSGEDRFRRGLYTFSKRTAPYAMFSTFDGPSGEACVAQREVSNSPLQALALLNDPVVIEAAQALGKTMLGVPGSLPERVQNLFRRCLTRPARPDEVTKLSDFHQAQVARFRTNGQAEKLTGAQGDRAAEQAAWTALARVLFNLDEAITKD